MINRTFLNVCASYVSVLFLFSCGGAGEYASKKDLTREERVGIENEELSLLLEEDFSNDSVQIDSVWLTAGTEIKRFYNLTGNGLHWYKDGKQLSRTKSFLGFIAKSKYYGLDSGFYQLNLIKLLNDSIEKSLNFYSIAKAEAKNDLLLTNAFMLLRVHLEKGLLDPTSNRVIWKKDSLENKSIAEELKNCGDTSFKTVLQGYEPNFIEYRYFKWALKNYLDSNALDTTKFRVPDPKKDSSTCWSKISEALLYWKYIDSIAIPKDTLLLAVKKFQRNNSLDGDGIIGTFSRQAFNTSNSDRFYYACLALEKWRWKIKRDGKIQFHVNIPSYELHVIRNDSIIKRHRVVTGATDHHTPTLTAKVRWVTLFPYWNVPHSISTKEILPFARRDTAYMRKHGYVLINNKKEIVPVSDVPWRKLSENYFPYRIRQNGGYGNSLGVVAFHFPNKYDVYLHDTPAKYFFKKTVRAFSHGCIRLQSPLNFAQFVLKQDRPKDTLNEDTLRVWIDRKYEQRINLKKPIPIELDYITVTSDSLGNIQFHPDVYLLEADLIRLMNPNLAKKLKPKKPKKVPEKKVEVRIFRHEEKQNFKCT